MPRRSKSCKSKSHLNSPPSTVHIRLLPHTPSYTSSVIYDYLISARKQEFSLSVLFTQLSTHKPERPSPQWAGPGTKKFYTSFITMITYSTNYRVVLIIPLAFLFLIVCVSAPNSLLCINHVSLFLSSILWFRVSAPVYVGEKRVEEGAEWKVSAIDSSLYFYFVAIPTLQLTIPGSSPFSPLLLSHSPFWSSEWLRIRVQCAVLQPTSAISVPNRKSAGEEENVTFHFV